MQTACCSCLCITAFSFTTLFKIHRHRNWKVFACHVYLCLSVNWADVIWILIMHQNLRNRLLSVIMCLSHFVWPYWWPLWYCHLIYKHSRKWKINLQSWGHAMNLCLWSKLTMCLHGNNTSDWNTFCMCM